MGHNPGDGPARDQDTEDRGHFHLLGLDRQVAYQGRDWRQREGMGDIFFSGRSQEDWEGPGELKLHSTEPQELQGFQASIAAQCKRQLN